MTRKRNDIDTCSNLDESQRNYAKRKKSVSFLKKLKVE